MKETKEKDWKDNTLMLLYAYLRLFRPIIFIVLILSQFSALYLLDNSITLEIYFWLFILMFFNNFGANAHNDIVDSEADKNKPTYKPISEGDLDPFMVKFWVIFSYIAALFIGYLMGTVIFIVEIIIVLSVTFYNLYGKRTHIIGLIVEMIPITTVFIIPMIITNKFDLILTTIGLGLWELMRNMYLQIEDLDGDTNAGFVTVPIKFSIEETVVLSSVCLIIGFAFCVTAYLSFEILTLPYLVGVLLYNVILIKLFIQYRVKNDYLRSQNINLWGRQIGRLGIIILMISLFLEALIP